MLEEFWKEIKKLELGFSIEHCKIFKDILSNIWTLENSMGIALYEFYEENYNQNITNPFFDCSGRFDVNPIEEYKDNFLKSNFINLLIDIKDEIGELPSLEEIDLYVAMKTGRFQELLLEKLSCSCKKSQEELLKEFLCDFHHILINIYDEKGDIIKQDIIINPFKDNELKPNCKHLYKYSSFTNLPL